MSKIEGKNTKLSFLATTALAAGLIAALAVPASARVDRHTDEASISADTGTYLVEPDVVPDDRARYGT